MTTKTVGYVSVDSGQLLLTDPCYIRQSWHDDEKENIVEILNDKKQRKAREGQYGYVGACIATTGKDLAGELLHERGHRGAGVAVNTGYGDGFYPVDAEYDDEGTLVSVKVTFVP